jgi:hypothetical protein
MRNNGKVPNQVLALIAQSLIPSRNTVNTIKKTHPRLAI